MWWSSIPVPTGQSSHSFSSPSLPLTASQYVLSSIRWTFNPVILKKVSTSEAPPRLSLTFTDDPFVYGEGDFVKISSKMEQVKELQQEHGEWMESMKQVGGAGREWVELGGMERVGGAEWMESMKQVGGAEHRWVELSMERGHTMRQVGGAEEVE